ncbi:unnamed protein product [Paramecium pentaurelia]|uniref:Tetratricopeptide repeat protein n=1 Tax=Paramecium pentaurelia TaxID=43138 RepID=A0A8S1XNE3_9CILI|nr:unnamed protein product [Paramecium pentaurelia]
MNEVEISSKNDTEILRIINDYIKQGYQVFLQKRCTDKFLMQTEYITPGVLDLDNSQVIIQNTLEVEDDQQKVSEISKIEKKQFEQSRDCSINDQCEKLAETIQKQHCLFSRDSLVFIPRQTITDFNKILSPQVKEQNDETLMKLYQMLQKGIGNEQEGQVELAIKQFTELIQEIELMNEDLQTSNLINVIYVEALLILGLLQSRISQYQQGKKNFEKCLRLFIIKDQILLAKIYLRVGQNCQQLFSYQKAIDYYVQALVIYEIYQLKIEISLTISYIGIVYAHLGNHDLAIKLGMQAIEEIKKIVKQDSFIMGQLYHAVGEIHYFNHDFEDAIEYFDAAYDIKIQYPKERLSQILTINYLGSSCYHLGEYKKAQELYEISLSQITEKSTLIEAQILNNLAMTKIAQNTNAKNDLDRAISIYLIYFSETHPSVRRALRNLKFQK